MEVNKSLMLRVGIFIVLGFVILVYFSLKAEAPTKVKDGYNLYTQFESIRGIEPGTMVTMSGVQVGRVDKIAFNSDSNKVRVDLRIEGGMKIRKDSKAGITIQSLLGQNIVNIFPGIQSSDFFKNGDEIQSRPTVDIDKLLETVSSIGEDAGSFFKNMNSNQEGLMKKLEAVVDENRDNLRVTTEAFAKVAPKLDSVISNLDVIVANVKNGEGTLGKMVTDETLYTNFKTISDNLANVSEKLNKGEGTLGKLLTDDSVHEEALQSFKVLKEAGTEVKTFLEDNRRKIGDVVDSLQVTIPNFQKASENVVSITDKINAGEGTLGKLVNDPALYNDTKDAVNQVKNTFQESEEQAVMRTFVGLVFSSLM